MDGSIQPHQAVGIDAAGYTEHTGIYPHQQPQYDEKRGHHQYAKVPSGEHQQQKEQHYYVFDSTTQQYYAQDPTQQQTPAPAPSWAYSVNPEVVRPWSACAWEWRHEVSWLLFSLSAFAALCAVLDRFDGGPMPRWGAGLTLNTVIALLGTMCRSAFVIPCVESVSQLKWTWFRRRERPLGDLQVFDEASRGAWGSVKLIFVTRGWILSSLPALLLITATLTGTLTQAVVTFETMLAPVGGDFTAQAPRSTEFFTDAADQDSIEQYENTMQRAVYNALNVPEDKELPLDPPTCSYSECRFPPFSTLSICGRVANITDRLSLSNTSANGPPTPAYVLPGGAYLGKIASKPGYIRVNITGTPTPLTFDNATVPPPLRLGTYHVIYDIVSPQHPALSELGAFEVAFHACANSYAVSVAANIASRNQTRPPSAELARSPTYLRYYNRTVPVTAVARPGEPGEGFPFSGAAVEGVMFGLSAGFVGFWGSTDPAAAGEGGEETAMTTSLAGHLIGTALRFGNVSSDGQVGAVMGNITRNVANGLSNTLLDPLDTITGTALANETFVRVRWAWLAFLASQIALSAAILLAAIIETRTARIGSAKSSALALLFAVPSGDKWALERGVFAGEGEQRELAEVVGRSSGVVGRFAPSGRGWMLR